MLVAAKIGLYFIQLYEQRHGVVCTNVAFGEIWIEPKENNVRARLRGNEALLGKSPASWFPVRIVVFICIIMALIALGPRVSYRQVTNAATHLRAIIFPPLRIAMVRVVLAAPDTPASLPTRIAIIVVFAVVPFAVVGHRGRSERSDAQTRDQTNSLDSLHHGWRRSRSVPPHSLWPIY